MDKSNSLATVHLASKLYRTENPGFYRTTEKGRSFIAGVCLGTLFAWYRKFTLIDPEAEDFIPQLLSTKPERFESIISQSSASPTSTSHSLILYHEKQHHLITYPFTEFNLLHVEKLTIKDLVRKISERVNFQSPFDSILFTETKEHAIAFCVRNNLLFLFDANCGFYMFSYNVFGALSLGHVLSQRMQNSPNIYTENYHIYLPLEKVPHEPADSSTSLKATSQNKP